MNDYPGILLAELCPVVGIVPPTILLNGSHGIFRTRLQPVWPKDSKPSVLINTSYTPTKPEESEKRSLATRKRVSPSWKRLRASACKSLSGEDRNGPVITKWRISSHTYSTDMKTKNKKTKKVRCEERYQQLNYHGDARFSRQINGDISAFCIYR